MTQTEVPALVPVAGLAALPERHAAALGVLRHGVRRLLAGLVVLISVLFISQLGLALSQGLPLTATAGQAARASVAYLQRLL